jgi:hypothetical protein
MNEALRNELTEDEKQPASMIFAKIIPVNYLFKKPRIAVLAFY